MLKPLLAVATVTTLLGTVTPAAADRGNSAAAAAPTAPTFRLGQAYELPQREHKKQLPHDTEVAKARSLTLSQVAAVAKQRHEEVAYCWDRLPPSQRVAGTAVLK